jgi:hypothetical protein
MMPRCIFIPLSAALAAKTVREHAEDDGAHEREPSWLAALPWLLVAMGSVLRVLWPLDMEWKFDEKWMFRAALRIADGVDPWPWLGMTSGVGTRNPGMSIWPFALLARVLREPIAMVQAVCWVNVLALWGFALWARFTWPSRQRAIGLWGVALYAVSPLAVLFSRKIWAQDVLVVFVLPWLWGHARREKLGFAWLWGFAGALLGQVHMSGFFAAFALAAVTFAFDRKQFPWRGWLAGSVLGALPLIPWLEYLASPRAPATAAGSKFTAHFFTDGLRHMWGLGLEYPLGKKYLAFLRGPMNTHVNAGARYALLLLLALSLFWLVRERKQLRLSEPVRTYLAAVLLAGVLLSVTGIEIYAHYLIVFGPLLHIGVAWLLRRHRYALLAVCSCQLLLTASFLATIHWNGGAPGGDYGKSYRAQSAEERALPADNHGP